MTLIGKEIGELLVDNGLLTPEDLGVVEQEKLKTGESISKILARLGFASENQLKDTLELQYGVTFVSLAKLTPDPELVKRVPEELIRQLQVVPISLTGSRLLLAMVNPDDSSALNEIRNFIQSEHVKAVVCIHDDFDTCVDGLFGTKADASHGSNGAQPTELYDENVEVDLEPDLSFIDDVTPLNIRASGINTGENALVDSTETIDASVITSPAEANADSEVVSELPPPDLGELLLAKGIIDDDQLYDALKIGLKTKQSLAEVLISMDLVTEEDLQHLLAEYFGSALVESFDEEESVEPTADEELYAQPVIREEAIVTDEPVDLLTEDLPETLEEAVADEQLGVTDELISEEQLESLEDTLSEEQLQLLDRVFAKEEIGTVEEAESEEAPQLLDELIGEEEPGLLGELLAEDEPELLDELVVEDEPELLDELVAEDEPELLDELVVEDEPELLDELVAEDEPELLDQSIEDDFPVIDEPVVEAESELIEEPIAKKEPEQVTELVAEQSPQILDELVEENQPEILKEAALEDQSEIVDETIADEQAELVDESIAEKQPEIVPEVVVEKQPEIVDEVIADDQTEIAEEVTPEEQPETVLEVVAEEQPEIANEVVAEEQPEVVSEVIAEEQPEAIPEVIAEEQPEAVPEVIAEERPEAIPEVIAEEQPEAIPEVIAEEQPETLSEVIAEKQPEIVPDAIAAEQPTIVDEVIAEKSVSPLKAEIARSVVTDGPRKFVGAPDVVAPHTVIQQQESSKQEISPKTVSVPIEKSAPLQEAASVSGPSAPKPEEQIAAKVESPIVEAKESSEPEAVIKTEPPVVPEAPKKLKGISVSTQKREIFKVDDLEDDPDDDLLDLNVKPAKLSKASRSWLNLRPVKPEPKQPDLSKILQPVAASDETDLNASSDLDELDDDIDFLDLVKQAQYASISLLANHITSSAIELKCSDILFQGVGDDVVVQYLKKGRVVSESKLVKQIHPDLVACYKEMAGLDKTVTNKPQDRKVKLNVRETDIELRVTTVPEDEGEIVQISIKYI